MKFGRSADYFFGVLLIRLFSFFMKKEPESVPIHKILLIKLAAAGDTILLMPVIRALRKAYPHAVIDWLVSPINKELAEGVLGVDHLRVLERQTPFGFLKAAVGLRKEKYDGVLDFEQWARATALLAASTGAAVRIGFDTPGQRRHFLFTRIAKKDFTNHEIREFFKVAELLGPLEWEQELTLPVLETLDEKCVPKAKKGPWILLHPGCGSDGRPREWPIENYAVLGQWLVKNYGARLFLTAGPEETHKTRNLKRLLNGAADDFGGRLSWKGLVALVARMDVVVSGNTGVMHIAAALKKKQVALHGPTNPALWGPLNPNAKIVASNCPKCPCLRLGFEYHAFDQSCMKRIQVHEVQAAVESLQPFC